MASTKIELNRAGVRALLRSAAVRRDLLARAGRVAAAAQANAPEHVKVVLDSSVGSNRARAIVLALGGYNEDLETRFLTSAIDAAR